MNTPTTFSRPGLKTAVLAALAAISPLMPNRSLASYDVTALNSTYSWTFYDSTDYGSPFNNFHAGILDGAANYSFEWAWNGGDNDVIAGVEINDLANNNYGWTTMGYNCGEAYNQYNPNDPSAQPSVMFYGWADKANPVEFYIVVVNPPPSIATVNPGTDTVYGTYRGTYWTTENNQSVHYDIYDQPMIDKPTIWGVSENFDQYHVYRRPSATIGQDNTIDLNAIHNAIISSGLTAIGDPSQTVNQRFCTETYGDSISGVVNASFWLN